MGRFVRLGLSYSFRTTDIEDPAVNTDGDPDNDIPVTFRQAGVVQSTLTPTISYNTLNNSLDPTLGQSLTLGLAWSGGLLGGKVNTIEPTFEYKFFRPFFAGREATRNPEPNRTRTFGMRALFGHIRSYGVPFQSNSLAFVGGTPLFARFFLGGEETIRGYGIRGISPTAPVKTVFSAQAPFAVNAAGERLRVRPPGRATGNSIAPSLLRRFEFENQERGQFPDFPTFIGGDTQILLNFEYRIPVVGPLMFVPFLDVGSVFNMNKLEDQTERTEFVANQFIDAVILNPFGLQATRRELRQARPPEIPVGGLPPGYQVVNILGDVQRIRQFDLTETVDGIFENYRYSFGGEFRVQVPVINVPFRLIFAWNPNARTEGPFFFEEKKAVRFSVGRTF